MQLSAEVVLDSVNAAGNRITTMQLVYPRFIHSEFMTHRVFSRNAMSSRAIPIARMLEEVRTNPVIPWHWGSNKPGMQAGEELEGKPRLEAIQRWKCAAHAAAEYAEQLMFFGVHKQLANRLLEPFQWMRTVVTATEWENFFSLRCHEAAEPHIHDLADAMKKAMHDSFPELRVAHRPYIRPNEYWGKGVAEQASAARCARVSYNKHDGTPPMIDDDLALATRLRLSKHASPFEHVAHYMPGQHANFYGWRSLRTEMGI